jgi:predicted  nucleic acid-binding Zn-ribbon protein
MLLVLVPAAAVVAVYLSGVRTESPPVLIAGNALVPGAAPALAGRGLLEVLAGLAVMAIGSLIALHDGSVWMYAPVAVVGGIWGSLYTAWSPVKWLEQIEPSKVTSPPRAESPSAGRRADPSATAAASSLASAVATPADDTDSEEVTGFKVAVSCTECGADVDVPVLCSMAECPYCGTRHLVEGQSEQLHLTLPERIRDADGLREAVLDHYRYAHYLKLYKRRVAPLESKITSATAEGQIVNNAELQLASEAAERTVSAQADAYRAKLASSLEITSSERFLAPYWHGMGTMYQAAFGRDPKSHNKQLEFAVGHLEAVTPAFEGPDLPAMGKLSYLRALAPAASQIGHSKVLPVAHDQSELVRAFGNLDRKQLVRGLNVIRLGSAFERETTALVWRPFWLVSVTAPGINDALLVDGCGGSVAGSAPTLSTADLEDMPETAASQHATLRFMPMQCPVCGHEFPFEPDALLHFCVNCHRLIGAEGHDKHVVEYSRAQAASEGRDIVPFWRFPLSLQTADGLTVTSLPHLTDGIDGRLDQIGEVAEEHQDEVLVPAFAVINAKLMAKTYVRMFVPLLGTSVPTTSERFPLDDSPPQPWNVTVSELQARTLLPLLLSHAFGTRDLARANVNQIEAWLFKARQTAPGTLTFLPVPKQMTEPFRRYVGRFKTGALERASGA